ncbi:MAG: acyl-CoA dehydrogenase family protein [Actinomycetota bacterium]
MPEHLPPELVDLRDRIDVLCRDRLVPLADDDGLSADDRDAAVRAASKEAGLFTMTQPADLGGTAAGPLALTVARDTLGRHNVGHLRGLFGPSPGALADVGEPLRSGFLAPFMAGEKRAGFAFTEPDAAPRHTWAALDGEELVINGQKSYVTGGGDADFLNTLVEVDEVGPAMVVIETDRAGVELVRRFGTLDGSHHAAFTFSDVRVPRRQLIGEAGSGMRVAMSTVTRVRMGMAADCVGLCRFVAEHLSSYLQRPHRSGQPLGALERNRLRYGDVRAKAYGVRAMLYRTARLMEAGDPAVNEAMATKLLATETVGELVDSAIQIVGGQALSDDHPLSATHRRVRALRLAEGASDVLRLNLARGDLDLGLGRI